MLNSENATAVNYILFKTDVHTHTHTDVHTHTHTHTHTQSYHFIQRPELPDILQVESISHLHDTFTIRSLSHANTMKVQSWQNMVIFSNCEPV